MIHENGNIAVHTENIFPIIKKWLYSDKDIFVRELVSNGCDAISKLKKLSAIGEAEIPEDTKYYVKVVFNKKDKTLQFIDNGIGMTAEEVKKYINQVAFSGAEDFLAKYKDKTDEGSQIIGHFGLGFYSAFMVAGRVEIDTLSYQKDAEAVKWICSGGTEYEMDTSKRAERGTTVTLHIAEDSEEFLDEFKLREILLKYCSFLPVEIYLENADPEKKDKKDGEKEEAPKPINDPHPLWLKKPMDCTDEEYKDFYRKVFHDFNEPLFWIHLNVDYPFNLKGILYFPKLRHEFESIEGQIKLYNNQVFVADNIKEVIPEFLMLLKGVLDCPDLPLNVSRSFLQNDGYVLKVSSHITKKVADKLTGLFNTERENYNRYWDDIHPFIKYGCIRDNKFYEKVKDIIIYKTINGEYVTLKQYLEKNESRHKNKVFYVTNEKQQAQYINLFKEQGLDAILLPSTIDTHFIQFLEIQEKDVKFNRIDSDLSESLKNTEDKQDETADKNIKESLEKIFKETLNNEKLKIQVENLKAANVSGMILLSEHSRRMQEMSAMFGGMDMRAMFPEEQTLVLNKNNNLIKMILTLKDKPEKKEDVKMICEQIYDLAMMSHKQLESEAMTRFIERSNKILTRLAELE
ncbi:MAG: molecular chaperone HtpG [Petroclostridium sp.]|jgi:molecular chaperone HtpG|uniref:molecular chaperone HtpG n=1 Tax=Petroclostridium xylanilyticum TaxID=1792311 RepID=UPI000B9847BD|nr:molecular chaperone HtpG [Petroclostridium xylanilyticum]MBZ4646048.1 molecular chaperone HtpG [Clostridia bacterium]MDK2811736.1 molecular chaperone HtpG [Petroclostridium sp.]